MQSPPACTFHGNCWQLMMPFIKSQEHYPCHYLGLSLFVRLFWLVGCAFRCHYVDSFLFQSCLAADPDRGGQVEGIQEVAVNVRGIKAL